MRVLLVEDEQGLGAALRDHLVAEGNAVDWAKGLAAGEDSAAVAHYDLILLDIQLPDGSGLDLLNGLRGRGDLTPVLILTARDQISDRIKGLNCGADDYIVKPFDLAELSARIMAVARRYSGDPSPVRRVGRVEIDRTARTVTVAGRAVDLTGREWAVLERLTQRPQSIVTKAQIEEALYAFGEEIESNIVEVYVSRLRKKLGWDHIVTIRGIGYRIEG